MKKNRVINLLFVYLLTLKQNLRNMDFLKQMSTARFTYISFLLLILFSLSGCEIIGDIFKAGVWVGIILVVLVIALIFWLIKKFMG